MEQVELIKECKRGKRRAQYQLYCLYAKAMFNVLIRLVPNREDAEDLLQESFVKAFLHMNDFDGNRSFGAWLKRIVINTALSHLRKKKLEMVEFVDYRHDVEEELDEVPQLNSERLHHAIKQLPNGARTVFALYQIEGYKHREIAEMLGVTESTSKAQYMRARNMLKEELKKAYYHE